MSKEYVVFGFSHYFGDIFDCIESVGGRLGKVVLNVPETPWPGRASLAERLKRLPYKVPLIQLKDFVSRGERFERNVIGFSGKQMAPLLKLLNVGLHFHPLIHARAILQSGACLDDGVIVDAGAIVGPWAKIGKHVALNRGSSVGHDAEVGAYSFLGPAATLCSHVRLGENVKVGANATILPDVTVADDVVIGAGAVLRDSALVSGLLMAGVPAVPKLRKKKL